LLFIRQDRRDYLAEKQPFQLAIFLCSILLRIASQIKVAPSILKGIHSMKTLESLKSIFKDRLFKIPDYQRGYAWTTRQLKDFWEDLVNLPADRYHYTGLLSLKEVSRAELAGWDQERWLIEDRGFKPFHIVDGQQRLTTFVIFIQEVVRLIKRLSENQGKPVEAIYIGTFSLKQVKEEYLVVGMPPSFILNAYKFGYETDNPRTIGERSCPTWSY
jgi:hypothetical protein